MAGSGSGIPDVPAMRAAKREGGESGGDSNSVAGRSEDRGNSAADGDRLPEGPAAADGGKGGAGEDGGDENMLSQFSRETGYTLSPAAFGQLAALHLEPRHLIPVLKHGSVDAKSIDNVASIREAPGMMTLRIDPESIADLLCRGLVEPEEGRTVAGVVLRVDDDRVIRAVAQMSRPLSPNVGDVMNCTVGRVSGPRVFVRSDDGFDGILNEIEFAYVPVRNVYDHLRPGDRIRLVVWRTESGGEIWFSFRRRLPNPWRERPFPYVEGQAVKGMVLYHTHGGCIVELPNAATGFLGWEQATDIPGGQRMLQEGQVITVLIVQINFKRCRIYLAAPRRQYG